MKHLFVIVLVLKVWWAAWYGEPDKLMTGFVLKIECEDLLVRGTDEGKLYVIPTYLIRKSEWVER